MILQSVYQKLKNHVKDIPYEELTKLSSANPSTTFLGNAKPLTGTICPQAKLTWLWTD